MQRGCDGRGARGRALVFAVALLAVTMGMPRAASARWLKAQTPHFEVYSNGDQRVLEDYAAKLEVFDSILRLRHGLKSEGDPPPRLKIYLVKTQEDLRRVVPTIGDEVAGFYMAHDGDIFAVGLRGRFNDQDADYVMFHEYVHHFMFQNYAYPYTSWLVEGYAEYYMATTIEDKQIDIGNLNDYRAQTLMSEKWIPMADLLSKREDEIDKDMRDNFYPQAWLLTHYMLSDPKRREQLTAYMKAVGQGQDSVSAMTAATGMTPQKLAEALHAYTNTRLTGTRLTLSVVPKVPVTVTTLPPSADDLLLEGERLAEADRPRAENADDNDDPKSKDPKERAKAEARDEAFLAEIRRKAARYPGDRMAELTLAEAEVRLGDRTAGEAILKRYLAANPSDVDALWLSGLSRLLAGDHDEKQRAGLYAEAGPYLSKAYKLDPNRYQVIYAYARSRAFEPSYPSENTMNCLLLAHQLAPQVDSISIAAGQVLLQRGDRAAGENLLTIVANDPHGGSAAKHAASLLKSFGAGTSKSNSNSK